ncbi:MAG TPA: hypothetical protein VIW67_20655 [Terriglobales bacterium]|jgi:hypothetical protein
MHTDSDSNDWHVIAEQASRETDPVKLLALTQKLTSMLEAEEARKQGRPPNPNESHPST